MPGNQDKEGIAFDELSSPVQGPIDDSAIEIALPTLEVEQLNLVTEDRPSPGLTVEPAINDQTENDDAVEPMSDVAMETAPAYPPELSHNVTVEIPAVTTELVIGPAKQIDHVPTTPDPESRLDSDDVDMLSASQLSQDLNRHLSQAMDNTASSPPLDRCLPAELDEGDVDVIVASSHNPRKRKASRLHRTGKTKRSRRSSQLSSDSEHLETSSISMANDDEMLDCIEVISSQPSHESVMSQQLSQEQTPEEPVVSVKRGRGRPRKRLRRSQSQDVKAKPCLAIETPKQGSDNGSAHIKRDVEDTNHVAATEKMPEAEPSSSAAYVDAPEAAEPSSTVATQEERAIQPDIVGSLQGILDRLKSSTPGPIDLRNVDELCFQIRYQAQVAAERMV
jgi:hypothetical protein